eukprot:724611_1
MGLDNSQPHQYINSQTIVFVKQLLHYDENEMEKFYKCLIDRGWCLIQYPTDITNLFFEVFPTINKHMESNVDSFGYSILPLYKQTLRILTADMFKIDYKKK